MITEDDLKSAIAECQGQRNPNASTCIKLASYYTILSHMRGDMGDNMRGDIPAYSYSPEPTEQVRYDSGSEFSKVAMDVPVDDLMSVMDELMDALMMLSPKLYRATMDKLRDL